jgi:N-acetylmuramoyl-L-alanine amidase
MQSYKIKSINIEKSFIIVLFSVFSFIQNVSAQSSDKQVLKTVCIDAGHGGHDPGCHGAVINEKTVCLSMALKLGKLIKENYPEINVIYTRDKDVFVDLDERAKIANRNKADLFICIHANSASPAAYGAETYVLGLHRTESQLKIAEKENSSIYLEDDGGAKYKDFDLSPDAIIFKQLQMSVYLDMAIKFAGYVQAEFKKLGRYDRGVKQAGFLVLYKTTMPSVLIETGFLTNPSEEHFLTNKASQKKMAEAMFVSFQKYKNELEGVDIMKGVTPTKEYKHPENDIASITTQPTKEVKQTGNNTSALTSDDLNNKVIFRVQIETSSTKIPPTSKKFNELTIYEYFQDGLYKYTAGEFVNDFNEANVFKNELREKGFKNAFIVAFYNGERIGLEEALKRSK